ncbi:heparinase II/III domain-containing protein [Flexithrix dorotheae]|uniref:heparinase II/III domain-containing protein n=1 Tax=Flexithrix dorotheae TaxID=70993 RepID=UPI001FE08C7F|nr:heparinase II/III family protein [Flexithrix dorotheae]
MKQTILWLFLCVFYTGILSAQEHEEFFKPDNPVTQAWLKRNIRKSSPKLILTKSIEKKIKSKLKNDELVQTYFQFLKQSADEVLELPPLERDQIGRRLLGVSREALRRIGALAMVNRLEPDQKYVDRLEQEIIAVCGFSDWNPSHFLDVGEMALAVSLGIDWGDGYLSDELVKTAKKALMDKALKVSFEEGHTGWVNAKMNWNQVCHGGISAAAIMLADVDPALSAKAISRAVEKLPLALSAYVPDGAYPEGPSYWDYGTSFSLIGLGMYESAFGTDFRLSQASGFMESADYRLLVIGPSGAYFNYSDAGDNTHMKLSTRGHLAWFAQKTGDALYLDREAYIKQTKEEIAAKGKISRLGGAILIWLALFEEEKKSALPLAWQADGHNPIAIIRSGSESKDAFFLGIKGGAGSVNHGNMDAGSFIFELNGVRWSVDPGNQGYNELEQIMGARNLWDRSQNSQRWSLVTKNNYCHSTLTVDNKLHVVDGFAEFTEFASDQDEKTAILDLTPVFKGQLKSVSRKFVKKDDQTLVIEDDFELEENNEFVTWAMMTQAEVATQPEGAVLTQDGKTLNLKIVSPGDLQVSVVALDPPPLYYDKKIEGLKRIEIKIPAYVFENNRGKITVELKGN